MSNGALIDQIPSASTVTNLLSQIQEQLEDVDIPDLPLSEIRDVAAHFNIRVPDISDWGSVIPSRVTDLLAALPDPFVLAIDLEAPLAQIRRVGEFDFRAEFEHIEAQLRSLTVPAAGVHGFSDELLHLLSGASVAVRESQLVRLVVETGRLFGLNGIEDLTANAAELEHQLKTLFMERVLSVFQPLAGLSSGLSLVLGAERLVGALVTTSMVEVPRTRFAAVLEAYGEGDDALARQLAATDLTDEAAVGVLRQRLTATVESWNSYRSAVAEQLDEVEGLLATFNVSKWQCDFEPAGQLADSFDGRQLHRLGERMEGLTSSWQERLQVTESLNLDEFDRTVRQGLETVRQTLDDLNLSNLETALQNLVTGVRTPARRLEDLKGSVEVLVRDAYQTIQDALAEVDLSPVQGALNDSLDEIEGRLRETSQTTESLHRAVDGTFDRLTSALKGATGFITDPDSGLKHQVEGVFIQLIDTLKSLNLDAVLGEIRDAVEIVAKALEKVEIRPTINFTEDAIQAVTDVLQAVTPLLVTDDLKNKLKEAADFLRQVDFDAISKTLLGVFDKILAEIDDNALGAFDREYQKVVERLGELDPAPVLEDLQREVFDPLLEQLETLDPGEILAPLQEGFDTISKALESFDPLKAVVFISDFFAEVQSTLAGISPEELLSPIESSLDEVRRAVEELLPINEMVGYLNRITSVGPELERFDSSFLLDRMGEGFEQLRGLVREFRPEVLLTSLGALLRELFATTGLSMDKAGLSALAEMLGAAEESLGGRLERLCLQLREAHQSFAGLSVQEHLVAVGLRYGELRSAFAELNTGDLAYGELAGLINRLDPMALLSPLSSRFSRVDSAYDTKSEALASAVDELSEMVAGLDLIRGAVAALGDPLASLRDAFLDPLRALLPVQVMGRPADILSAFLDAIDPRQWRGEIQAVAEQVKSRLEEFTGSALVEPIKGALQDLQGLLDLLDVSDLREVIEGVSEEAQTAIARLDPTSFFERVAETYERILVLLEELDPAGYIIRIRQLYNQDVVGVVQAVSPEGLFLEPLRDLFRQLSDLLGELDIAALFAPVLDRLRDLRVQLAEGLEDAGQAYNNMLQALPD